MKQILRLAIAVWVPLVLVSSGGCGGGLTQKDMMRHARRRSPAEDDEPDGTSVTGQRMPPAETAPASTGFDPASASSAVGQLTAGKGTAAASEFDASIDPRASEPPLASPAAYAGSGELLADASQALSPEASRRQAIAKLERIAEALEAYCQDKGYYPAPAIYGPRKESLLSWRVELLPYLGHPELYQKFARAEPWDSKQNQPLLAEIPAVFISPAGRAGRTNLLFPVGPGTAFSDRYGTVPRRIEDGAENTVILLETDNDRAVPWTAPEDYQVNLRAPTLGLGRLRAGGFLVVWGGGTVNWIDASAPQRELQAIFTADAGDGVTAAQVGHDPLADLAPIDPNIPLADGPLAAAAETTSAVTTKRGPAAVPNEPPLGQLGAGAASATASPTVPQRQPVPSGEALTRSKELLRDLYQQEYKAAATPPTRQALAQRLLDQLQNLDADVPGQYALLETVRRISLQSGAVQTALQAVEEMSTRFDIDSHATKLETLVGLSRSSAGPEAGKVVGAATKGCREAMQDERYDEADQMCGIALAASQKLRNTKETTKLQQLRQEVQAAGRAHRLAERALETLAEKPDDRRAVVMLGKYLCLVRQDWANGLPILARGDDPQLVKLANSELDQPTLGEEQIKLGDAWWQVAEKANVAERSAMLVRAAYWYRLASPVLPAGLARVKVEHRLRQIEQSLGKDAVGIWH